MATILAVIFLCWQSTIYIEITKSARALKPNYNKLNDVLLVVSRRYHFKFVLHEI